MISATTMTSIIAIGEYPQVKLDDMVASGLLLLSPTMRASTVILMRKTLCETGQCSKADIISKGSEQRYGSDKKYVSIWAPFVAVDIRRPFRCTE
jgi:hypothetical protein